MTVANFARSIEPTDCQKNLVLCGDSRIAIENLAPQSVDTIVTSPPYFSQRDYYHPDQIGSETTPETYITNLVSVFRAAKRVLKDTGTLWVNLGDKYQDGELCGMPWRCALALVQDGWILRSDIIWHKPNAMPSSVKTRPTTDHEYIFMFSKSKTYYYDADSIREPHVTFSENSKMKGGRGHFGKNGGTPENGKNKGNQNLHHGQWDKAFHPKGRNKRTVWNVPLSKFRDAHFAVFPEALVEPCVLAGSPKGGVVLDPFFGSGTTGLVAKKNQRSFIGIELNPEYCEMAKSRLEGLLL
jgi:DNA modification methylase